MAQTIFSKVPNAAVLNYHIKSPSFAFKIRERFHRRKLEEMQGRPNTAWRILSKLGAYTFLDLCGLNNLHPHVHRVLDGIQQLKPEHLQEPVTVKPLRAASSKGVFLLDPLGDGRYLDVARAREVTFEKLANRARRSMDRHDYPDLWVVEEQVKPAISSGRSVEDFKFYAFSGRIALILHRRREGNRPRYRWYDENWSPVTVGKYDDRIDDGMEPPLECMDLEESARRISTLVPFPFMRIDMYHSTRGPLLGELTAIPGGYDLFQPEWDQHLGMLWEETETTPLNAQQRSALRVTRLLPPASAATYPPTRLTQWKARTLYGAPRRMSKPS